MFSDKQLDFLTNSTHDINLASGAIRSGKTHIANIRFFDFLYNESIPNVDILITGKKADAVERNIIVPFLDFAESAYALPDFIYTRSPRKLVFKRKNITCHIEGANDEGAEARIRGMTVQAILGDECTLWPRSFFLQAMGRVSAGCRYKWLTCNPDAPSHYIQTEIIDAIQQAKLDGKVWYFTLEDNPGLDPHYVEQIKRMYTGVFYDRFIDGKWIQSEGVIYDKFNRKDHLIEDIDETRINDYILGIDWGYENPLAIVLLGVDYDGVIYVIDEIYIKHQNIDNELHSIIKSRGWLDLQRSGRKMPISYAYGDPARPDYNSLFYKLTGIPTFPAINNVIEGIQEIQRRFVRNKQGRFGIYIRKINRHIIKEFESYRWKTDRSGKGRDEPVKDDDHLMDALRYAAFTYTRGRVKPLSVNPFSAKKIDMNAMFMPE